MVLLIEASHLKSLLQLFQSQNVMKLISDWWMDQQLMRVEWRYVTVGYGDQYVIITGGSQIHKWCVDNWDMEVSIAGNDFKH